MSPLSDAMQYSYYLHNRILVLTLEGELLGLQGEQALMSLVESYAALSVHDCVIDIGNVQHINSAGLGLLIKILTKLRNNGGELILVKPCEQVSKILVITKLNQIFKIAASRTEAIQQFQ